MTISLDTEMGDMLCPRAIGKFAVKFVPSVHFPPADLEIDDSGLCGNALVIPGSFVVHDEKGYCEIDGEGDHTGEDDGFEVHPAFSDGDRGKWLGEYRVGEDEPGEPVQSNEVGRPEPERLPDFKPTMFDGQVWQGRP